MSGRGPSAPLKAAWVLTGFVIVAGAALWGITGRPAFAIFVGLGLVTAVGAWATGRNEARARAAAEQKAAGRTAAANQREAS